VVEEDSKQEQSKKI